ncbi:MAG TPA: roadblock/LC7 domain-containing protein [Kofleriaceae bacterium]|jgi:predicted regulator of Ras-like GTPase activity (Roadblock/LC7/MglB family)|nr:roadblock/LC7 domain-containing protein [Kofleriaceae bacterium]
MLEPILQSLREVEGVQGAMVVDPSAAVVAHRAHTIYDLSVLQQVARAVVNSVDSVQLIQDDWDMMTAHFGDGKLLLRSLRTSGSRARRYVLAVIADATLNVAFLSVALRVAATKLLAELESAVPSQSSPVPTALAAGSTGSGRIPIVDQSRPVLEKTGLTWSGAATGSGSGVGSSDVGVVDPASSTFLSACTKALAASIGPMAKVFVKEAVRKVCGERPFTRADGPALLAHLAAGIEDSDDRASFQRATRTL